MKTVTKKVEAEYKKLLETVRKHDHYYYTLQRPIIDDYSYDKLYKKLLDLEKKYPPLQDPKSPTKTVGAQPLDVFEKVPHLEPMLSLENSYNSEEVKLFVNRMFKRVQKILLPKGIKDAKDLLLLIEKISFFCEPKIDGVSIELIYEEGELKAALTRGNGLVGENVLLNATTIKNIPLKLNSKNTPKYFEVRGEIFISKKSFEALNKKKRKNSEETFSNARNTAAGALRQLDPKVAKSRKLEAIFYSLHGKKGEELSISSQEDIIKKIISLSFPSFQKKYFMLCEYKKIASLKKDLKVATPSTKVSLNRSLKEALQKVQNDVSSQVISYYESLKKRSNQLPFEADGVVIKVNPLDLQKELDHNGKSWNWAFAGKFDPDMHQTTVQDILIQVGRTGVLTPVAIMDPVELGGVTVTKATLHNQSEIKRLNVNKGALVIVKRAGEVIPKIVRTLKPSKSHFKIPLKCPVCNSPCKKESSLEDCEGAVPAEIIRCVNKDCSGKKLAILKHFASKKAMDIEHLGGSLLETLFEKGFVETPSGIYSLRKETISSLEKQGDKSAQRLLESIEKRKSPSLSKFIYSLGTPLVGEKVSEYIAQHSKTADGFIKIFEGNTEEQLIKKLTSLNQLGSKGHQQRKIICSIKEHLPYLRKEVQNMKKAGVRIKAEAKPIFGGLLSEKRFVITGQFKKSRSEIESLIKSLGGIPQTQVSQKTDYLLVGNAPGASKIQKALKFKTERISWESFEKLQKTLQKKKSKKQSRLF